MTPSDRFRPEKSPGGCSVEKRMGTNWIKNIDLNHKPRITGLKYDLVFESQILNHNYKSVQIQNFIETLLKCWKFEIPNGNSKISNLKLDP